MVGAKIASAVIGLVIMGVGIAWLWEPVGLMVFGEAAEARVAFIEQRKPGQDTVVLTTKKELSEAEDFTRNASFIYFVRFDTGAGETVEAPLNYAQVLRPTYSIGDHLWVQYDPDEPREDVIDVKALATWAFGGFFFGIGAIITVVQSIILYYARTPIELDLIGSEMAERAEAELGAEDEERTPRREGIIRRLIPNGSRLPTLPQSTADASPLVR
ncbi:MAG: DUF3592 domain-containing protein [Phycisphaeraceae bacterium]